MPKESKKNSKPWLNDLGRLPRLRDRPSTSPNAPKITDSARVRIPEKINVDMFRLNRLVQGSTHKFVDQRTSRQEPSISNNRRKTRDSEKEVETAQFEVE